MSKEHPLHIRLALLGATMEVVGHDLAYEIADLEKELEERQPPYLDFELPMPNLFDAHEGT